MAKQAVKQLLARAGYRLIKSDGAGGFSLFNANYLKRVVAPRTVIDVGVGYGTPALYSAFPDAYFILVEPLVDYEDSINDMLKRHRGRCHYTAVSDFDGTVTLDVNTADLHKTSSFQRSDLTSHTDAGTIEQRQVPVQKLDALLAPLDALQRPLVVKIDTEGNELRVLRGATRLLEYTDYLILEASIAKRFEGSYEFAELLEFLTASGFRLYSILSVAHLPGEDRPRYADLMFFRDSGA